MLSLIINKKMKKLLIPVKNFIILFNNLGRSFSSHENISDESACLKTLPLTAFSFYQKLNRNRLLCDQVDYDSFYELLLDASSSTDT